MSIGPPNLKMPMRPLECLHEFSFFLKNVIVVSSIFLPVFREGQPARALSGIVAHNIRNGKRQVLLDEISITFAEFPDRVVEHLIQDKIVFKASGGKNLIIQKSRKASLILNSTSYTDH